MKFPRAIGLGDFFAENLKHMHKKINNFVNKLKYSPKLLDKTEIEAYNCFIMVQ